MSRLYRRPDSPNWYYTDGSGSDRIMKSTGTANRRIAEMIRAKWDEMIILEKHGIKLKKITCQELYNEYIKLIESRKSASWTRRIKTAFVDFLELYGGSQISSIDVKDINDFITFRMDKGRANKTVRDDVAVIKALFKYAIDNKYIPWNPCDDVMLPPKKITNPRKPIPRDIFMKVVDLAWREDDRLFWKILYYTGLRVSDAGTLKPENIKENVIELSEQTKTGEPVRIPLHRDLIPYKDKLIDLMPTLHKRNRSRKRFQKILKEEFGGMKGDLHSIRHSFNNELRNLGLSYEDRKALLGHTSASQVTMDYTHTNTDLLKEYIDKL